MRKIDIMIIFDVFEGISDQYFVEKNQTNFFAKKKLSKMFRKGTPFGIYMKSNVNLKMRLTLQNVSVQLLQRVPPLRIATFFEILKININV